MKSWKNIVMLCRMKRQNERNYANIYVYIDGVSGYMRHFGYIFKEAAQFHIDFHVLQPCYVHHMDASGIAGSGNYGGCCGCGSDQRSVFCNVKKDPCHGRGGQ